MEQINLNGIVLPKVLINKISRDLIERYQFIPISLKDNVLTCVFSETPASIIVEYIESVTTYKIKIVLAPKHDIQTHLKKLFPEPELLSKPTPNQATNIKPEKKKLDERLISVIGIMFGFSLAWAVGIGGLIPYIIGAGLGFWVTRKILNSEKAYVKIVFWVLFVIIFVIGLSQRGARFNRGYSTAASDKKDFTLLETDKNPQTSQVIGNLYRNTKYKFRIKFPEGWKIGPGDGPNIVQKASLENSSIGILIKQFDLEGVKGVSSIKDAGNPKDITYAIIDGMKGKMPDVKIINYGETKIDNEPAYWLEYSGSYQVLDHQLEMIQIQYILAKGDIMYFISAGTASNEYLKLKPVFQRTVETFVLENY